MGKVKSIMMDMMEETRVYMEINWFETEVDMNLMEYNPKRKKYKTTGLVMEGPRIGEEIPLSDKVCRMAIAKYEQEKEAQW